ncbi:Predicted Zn-dependent peptidase [Saccharicrinis carchari]|uniref:Predicted Zn-dependent peptidase n=1 Tax=Saccharicrinis carchari TaxID=1168039 RepID=A0A521E295_SACCC|nr:pitrilysin family protein [Saccharicrinis carchari]SMO78076.1 Predicted Zn-dependent peptidase [Saccharicrinis carchari]
MLKRKEVPMYALPTGLNMLKQKELSLKNGVPVHFIQGGTQEVAKIDFIFSAGVVQSNKPLVAALTNTLLQEGTEWMTSFEVSEKIDFFGAFLGQSTSYHHAQITLYTLSRYLPDLLPVIEQILKKPALAQHEFDVLLARKKQDFLVDSEKVKNLAYRKSQEVLFGEDHPYGRVAKLHHFSEVSLSDVQAFHKTQYASNLCTLIVSGQPGEGFLDLLNKHFGGNDWGNRTDDKHEVPEVKSFKKTFHLEEKENALQSAIRIVRPCVSKKHPDFLPLLVLNTLFGGYFGSRLMNNLREEKGLTYGISSYLTSLLNVGIFGVATEVMANMRQLAIDEIFNEMDKLRNFPVEEEELTRLKNYMLGDLMRNLDGPFAMSDAYRGLLGFGLDFDYFKKVEHTIQHITSSQLHQLANKYLLSDDFYVIVAGK